MQRTLKISPEGPDAVEEQTKVIAATLKTLEGLEARLRPHAGETQTARAAGARTRRRRVNLPN
jgi:hypothetical protein